MLTFPVHVLKLSFNPTLVRLRPSRLCGLGEGVPAFQSHAGSIEASLIFFDFSV